MGGRYGKYGETKRLERLRRGDSPRPVHPTETGPPVCLLPDGQRARIRLARPGDAAFVTGLARESFASFGPYGPTVAEWFESPNITTLIALRGKEPLGFLMTSPAAYITFVLLEIMAIAVAPDARRLGIGSLLLSSAEERAVKDGGLYILLHTAVTNLAAQSFFFKHGYLEVGRKPRYYPEGQDALRMIKKLR